MTSDARAEPSVYLEPDHTDDTFTWKPDCRLFVGGLPCRHWRPCHGCNQYDPVSTRVLIVMLGLLGDMLIASPLPRRIKRDDPAAHVSWLVDESSAPVLRMNPDIDRVLVHGWETTTQLLSESFDLVLGFERTPSAGAIVDRVIARRKAGIAHGSGHNSLYAIGDEARHFFKMNTWNDFRTRRNTTTWTELYFQVAGYSYDEEPYVMEVPNEAKECVEIFLGTRVSPRVCLNLGGSLPTKLLPVGSWIEVGRALVRHGIQIVVTGGPEQDEQCRAVVAGIGALSEDDVRYRPLSLEEFAAIPGFCDVIVTADSFGFHVGLAHGTRCVLLLGPSHVAEVLPKHIDHVTVVRSSLPCSPCAHQVACGGAGGCMDVIAPREIVAAIHEALARATMRPTGQTV